MIERKEKKSKTVFRIIDRQSGEPVGIYSRAYCVEYDFQFVDEGSWANVDDESQCPALEGTQPILPLGLGYFEYITHDYVRHGTTTLCAALDAARREVIAHSKKYHRHPEIPRFSAASQ